MVRVREPAVADPAERFTAARDTVLYLLSFHASASAFVAWGIDRSAELATLGLGLAAALLGGRLLASQLVGGADPRARARLRLMGSLLHGALVALTLTVVLSFADPAVAARASLGLALVQATALALSESDRGARVSLANAFALVVLAMLRGGAVAAVAAVGTVALLPLFLSLDHHADRLGSSRARRAPALRSVLAQAAGFSALPVLVLAGYFLLAPAAAYAPFPVAQGGLEAMRGEVLAAYRRVVALGLVSGGLVLLAARLLRWKGADRAPLVEQVEAETIADEALPRPLRRGRIAYAGPRGRVVRCYVRALARAERRGLLRRPGHTASEIRALLREPAAPLARLTELFSAARYGPDDPDPEDVEAAERAAAELIRGLEKRSSDARGGAARPARTPPPPNR